jgi:hypothetical protein
MWARLAVMITLAGTLTLGCASTSGQNQLGELDTEERQNVADAQAAQESGDVPTSTLILAGADAFRPMTGVTITEDQKLNTVRPRISRDGDPLTIEVDAERQESVLVADWFNAEIDQSVSQNSSGEDSSERPDQLEFAFCGGLYVDGVGEPEFTCFGQASNDRGEESQGDWWIGFRDGTVQETEAQRTLYSADRRISSMPSDGQGSDPNAFVLASVSG